MAVDFRPKLVILMVFAVFLAASGANLGSGVAAAQLDPVLSVTPKLAIPNQTVTIFGTGFSSDEIEGGALLSGAHQITGQDGSVISFDGVPLRPPDVSYPVNFDAKGSWAASVNIPLTLETVAGEPIQITAVDDQGVTQTVQLDFQTPVIRVDPPTASRNSDLIVSGLWFPSSNTATAPNVQVAISYAGVELAVLTPSFFGELDAILKVPLTAVTPSINVVLARIIGFDRFAFTTHAVPGPGIIVSPNSGMSGSVVTINGADFPTSATISSIRVGNKKVSGSQTQSTDRNGEFVLSFVMPLLSPGVHTITVLADGISAVIAFTVTEGTVLDQPLPAPQPSSAPTQALETLTENDNLIRVWTFDNASKSWTFFDPRPAFSLANTITTMEPGRVYWLKLNRVQTAPLNGKSRVLFSGWNLLPW